MRFVPSPFLSLLLVLSLAGCVASNAATTGLSLSPRDHNVANPQYITAVWNPTDPRLTSIVAPAQVNLGKHGNYLVADIGTFDRRFSKVVEITPSGHVVWALYGPGLGFVHSAYLTDQGTILVSDTNNNRVIEVDRQGNIVWSTDNLGGGGGYLGQGRLNDGSGILYPNDAKELPNGHFLISSRMNSTVFEIDRTGHVYWKCRSFINLQGQPDHLLRQHNPHRLPNGDTLIADSDNARVVEVNPSCTREVWEYSGTDPTGIPNLIWPRDANIIDDNMTFHVDSHHYDDHDTHRTNDVLIDDSKHNRIIEVTHDSQKRIVAEWDHIYQPYSETVLNNGTFLLGSAGIHGVAVFNLGEKLLGVIPTRPTFTLAREIVNPGFEPAGDKGWGQNDLLTESLPPGTRADMSIDSSEKHGGLTSGRISWSDGPHESLWWGQAIRLKPTHRYIFTGWIKTNSVGPCAGCDFGKGTAEGSTAYYLLKFLQPGVYEPPPDIILPLHSGTHDWTEDKITFDAPDGVAGIDIECTLDGKGTVWFDDVTLTDKGSYHKRNPG